MPALTDIGKFKRLAELFVMAMRADSIVNAGKNQAALDALIWYGLTERQAESFINGAFRQSDKGMVRSLQQVLEDVSTSFRRREHANILAQIQSILEQGRIDEEIQEFFDLCSEYLYA